MPGPLPCSNVTKMFEKRFRTLKTMFSRDVWGFSRGVSRCRAGILNISSLMFWVVFAWSRFAGSPRVQTSYLPQAGALTCAKAIGPMACQRMLLLATVLESNANCFWNLTCSLTAASWDHFVETVMNVSACLRDVFRFCAEVAGTGLADV